MKLTINVTQDDIQKGERAAQDRCPIALALRRTTGLPFRVTFGFAFHCPNESRCEVPMPPEAARFAWDFDGGHRVFPQQFTFEVPEELYKQLNL